MTIGGLPLLKQLMSHHVRLGFQNALRGRALPKLNPDCNLAENNSNQVQDIYRVLMCLQAMGRKPERDAHEEKRTFQLPEWVKHGRLDNSQLGGRRASCPDET